MINLQMDKYKKHQIINNKGQITDFHIIDKRDEEIINLMLNDPEITTKEIGLKLGMSQPSAHSRLTKLKDNGVIKYVIEVSNYVITENILVSD